MSVDPYTWGEAGPSDRHWRVALGIFAFFRWVLETRAEAKAHLDGFWDGVDATRAEVRRRAAGQ